MPSAIKCTGKPDVFVVTIAPGLRNWATRASNFLFISRFSATTSMIQSASAQRARSSSKFPIAIFSAIAAVKNAAGFDFFAASSPARTILLRSPADASAGKFGGTMSSKMHGNPAFAKCAAILEPIVPAPSTTAFSMRRFMARRGVLRVLREAGIPIDCVAGTSVGALIAVGYCAGASLEEMANVGTTTNFKDFGRWTPSWLGLATNQRMEKYLERFTPVKTFEELQTPLAIATTDITAGVSVYYSHGPIAPPLRGSCAYPGLFVPIQFEGRALVDGFVTSPVPVEGVLLLGADVVIAVYLEAERPRRAPAR